MSYLYRPSPPRKTKEVVIRAQNGVGPQTAPALGDGHRFRTAFPDNGIVVDVMNISTTSVVILTWSLPQLAMSNDVTTDFFEIAYFDEGNPTSVMTANVTYDSSSPGRSGFSADLLGDNNRRGAHTFSITAVYSTPMLRSSPATVTGVRAVEEGKWLL